MSKSNYTSAFSVSAHGMLALCLLISQSPKQVTLPGPGVLVRLEGHCMAECMDTKLGSMIQEIYPIFFEISKRYSLKNVASLSSKAQLKHKQEDLYINIR